MQVSKRSRMVDKSLAFFISNNDIRSGRQIDKGDWLRTFKVKAHPSTLTIENIQAINGKSIGLLSSRRDVMRGERLSVKKAGINVVLAVALEGDQSNDGCNLTPCKDECDKASKSCKHTNYSILEVLRGELEVIDQCAHFRP